MTTLTITTKYQWLSFKLTEIAYAWYERIHKRMRLVSQHSAWWFFIRDWKVNIMIWLKDFRSGYYHFSPMMQYEFSDEVIRAWSYLDRLMLHLILKIIKRTLKHVISPLCMHLPGPSAIKHITQSIKATLNTENYNYFLRLDIRSYYASINQRILLAQLYQNYDDPILHKYFEEIVTTGGARKRDPSTLNIFIPGFKTKGLTRRIHLHITSKYLTLFLICSWFLKKV